VTSLEQRLALLEAEREIKRTMHSYSTALDGEDEELFVDCFLDEAVLRWPSPPYDGPYSGSSRLRAAFRAHTHAPAVLHKHFVADQSIALDGDTARAESYFMRVEAGAGGPYIRSFGRYLDVLRRCPDGRWRFEDRRVEPDALVLQPHGD
jgi:ketosteroid isomerase-like protein